MMRSDFRSGDRSQEKRKPGRPRCEASPEQVRALRESGMSWRLIGSALGISKASAARLGRGVAQLLPSQNPINPSQKPRADEAGLMPLAVFEKIGRAHV